MSDNRPLLQQLIDALRCLPGVGNKSAQRMAFYILQHNRDGAKLLAEKLIESVENIGECSQCRNLSESDICNLCINPKRDKSLICVVESPANVIALEQATGYQGLYFVLHGHLSPLDGIGPDDLGLEKLARIIQNGSLKELIIATNPTVEGEATSYYIQTLAKKQGLTVSRIAHGVPLGGELEFIDQGTLAHAFGARLPLED
ncbi:MAG: recombination mediator RecR [Xanthomonadales bacterium]|nr:recombination mediator RecR [Xanthomonadales bacterium]